MIRWPNIGLWGQFEPCEQGILQAINYNFEVIDSLIQMAVIDFADNLPVDPEIGDKYILRSDNSINIWNGTGWDKIIPKPGYLSYVGGTGAYGDPYTDGRFFYFTGIEWRQFEAGGSGQGVKNYFPNPEFVNGFEGTSLYENTGGYVDGQGGSPDVTMAIDSLTPISGEATLRMIKPSQNTINQGWSFDSILIDPQDQNRDFYFGFTIDLRDPNYIADDIEIIFYDVDNGAVLGADYVRDVISLADISTLAGGIFKVRAKVQGMNTTHVRMSVNVKTSSSVAFNIGMDVLIMSPDVIPVTLGELHDVVITNPQTGQVLFFQSPNWINKRLQAQDVDYAGYGSTVKDELDYKTLVDIHQNSRLSNAEGDIGSLDVRVGTAEGDIDALELQALDFVKGPGFAASTDGNLAAFDMTSGRLIKEVPVNATNDGNVTTPGNLAVRSIDTQESTILGDSKSFFKTLGLWTKYKNVVPGPTPEPDPLGTPDADFTFTHDDSNTNPYGRIGSLRIGKPSLSGNVQGNGGFLNQFIEKAMRGAWAEFSYSHINLGGYIPNSLKVFVYDVTNSAWLDIVGDANVPANEGIHRIKFYIPSNTTDLRIFTHMTSTEASTLMAKLIVGYDIKPVDPVSVPLTMSVEIDLAGSGDFTAGKILVSKVGQSVNISQVTDLTCTATPAPTSAVGLIPEWARPAFEVWNVLYADSGTGNTTKVGIMTNGQLTFRYASPGGTSVNISLINVFSIAYTTLDSTNTTQGLAVNANPSLLVVGRSTSDQVIGTSSTPIVLNTVLDTKGSGLRLDDTTGRIIANRDITVEFGGALLVQKSSAGALQEFYSRINGTTVIGSYDNAHNTAVPVASMVSKTKVTLKKDDYIELVMRSGSGTNTIKDFIYTAVTFTEIPFSNTALMATPEAKMRVDGYLGVGSTNLTTIRYDQIRENKPGSFFTYNSSAALGDSFTINVKGRYRIAQGVGSANNNAAVAGITVNSADPSANIHTITYANGFRAAASSSGVGLSNTASWSGVLNPGDIVRTQFSATTSHLYNFAGTYFEIEFLGYVS